MPLPFEPFIIHRIGPRSREWCRLGWILLVLEALGISPGLLTTATFAQDLVTIRADSLSAGERDGLPVEQLFGHVQFMQGTLYGSADHATRYTTLGKIELTGNVEIHQDTLALYAPSVTYDGISQVGYAEGGVRVTDRDVVVRATRGDYDVNNQTAHFHDHVLITQFRNVSRSDNATYFRSSQTTILTGNVSVQSDSGTLTADRVTHSQALDETIASGSVRLRNDSVRLSSDWFYNSRTELRAKGRVIVEDLKNRTIIYGDTLARHTDRGYTIVPERPLLVSYDSSIRIDQRGDTTTIFDTLFIRARTMEMYQDTARRFIATDSVRVLRTNFSARGGRLIYDDRLGTMIISAGPRQHVWYDTTEINADSIVMLLQEKRVHLVHAIGRAFATSPVSDISNAADRINQLQGERMLLTVVRDTARNLLDMQNALSIYFLVREGRPDGVNRASGDTIRIDFANKSVSRMAVLSGTEGEYFPERFVRGRAPAFRLSAYERNLQMRPLRPEFVAPWSQPVSLQTPSASPAPVGVPPASDTTTSTATPAIKRKRTK